MFGIFGNFKAAPRLGQGAFSGGGPSGGGFGGPGAFSSVGPVGSTLFGGFPGYFPGAGPGQSLMIGAFEAQQRCAREGRCPVVYGPPAFTGW